MFSSITRQLKRARSAVKSVLAIADTAATTLEARLKPFLQEGELLGVEPLMLALVRWIQDGHGRLEEREGRQLQAERQLKKLRLRRDNQQEALYGMLLRIRKIFEDAFGPGTAPIYLGLEARLNDLDPVALRRVAREAVNILTGPAFTTPEPRVKELWENPARYAEQIEELLVPFETSLDDIESQKRELEKALKAKSDLLAELRDSLTWSIRFFEAIYRLADLGFHADRLRLTVASRPSSGEANEGSSDGAAGAAGAAGEAGNAGETDGGEQTSSEVSSESAGSQAGA